MFTGIKISSLKETKPGLVPISYSIHQSEERHALVRLLGSTLRAWMIYLSKICQVEFPMGNAMSSGSKPGEFNSCWWAAVSEAKSAPSQPHHLQLQERLRLAPLSLRDVLGSRQGAQCLARGPSSAGVSYFVSRSRRSFCVPQDTEPSPSWLKLPSRLTWPWPSSTL